VCLHSPFTFIGKTVLALLGEPFSFSAMIYNSQDKDLFMSKLNATLLKELEKFGYTQKDFTGEVVAEKAWGLCTWFTKNFKYGAGFEILCILIICGIITAIWFCFRNRRRLQSVKPEIELKKLIPKCCKENEHKPDQSIPQLKQKD
jgi:hypothetical protein